MNPAISMRLLTAVILLAFGLRLGMGYPPRTQRKTIHFSWWNRVGRLSHPRLRLHHARGRSQRAGRGQLGRQAPLVRPPGGHRDLHADAGPAGGGAALYRNSRDGTHGLGREAQPRPFAPPKLRVTAYACMQKQRKSAYPSMHLLADRYRTQQLTCCNGFVMCMLRARHAFRYSWRLGIDYADHPLSHLERARCLASFAQWQRRPV